MKPRRPFQGVWNIVRFNWPMFALSAGATALLGAVAASRAPRALRLLAGSSATGAGLLSVTSLAASHWIYDRSDLYSWNWLQPRVPPQRVLNIHAGFDESSDALTERFPDAELVVADFYDPVKNTEASIARARRAYPPNPRTARATADALPVADGWADLVIGFLAIHEIRDAGQRRRFFAEARRACAPGATFVLVEHLRDPANFFAFGPGFLHFHSRRTWLEAATGPFRLASEATITPFVRIFTFETA